MNSDIAIRSSASRLHHLKDAAWMPLIVATAYYIGAEVAFLVGTLSDKIFAPFWPPNIVLLCALLVVPRQRWWLCILATFPAHLIAELRVGMPPAQLLVAFVTNCAVAVASAVALQRFLGAPPWFSNLRKVFLYVLITAVACPAVVALGGAFVPILGGGAVGNYWVYWAQWYMANAFGSLTLGPVALIWLLERPKPISVTQPFRLIEVALLGLALVAVCAFAFEVSAQTATSGFLPALVYLPLPLVLWSAVRFGVKGASAAVLIVTVVLIWRTLNGPSVFIVGDAETSVFAMQTFLIGLAIPVLLLGASIGETRRAEQKTRESEERMAFAAVAADVCLWHFDYQSDTFWLTDRGREMFGFDANERVTRYSVISAIHLDDREAALDSMQSAISGSNLTHTEFRIVRRDEEVRWISARARADRNSRGEVVQVSGTFADVTERKAADEEAAQRQRDQAHLARVSMLGELSGGLAHELTQPLTAILSNAQAARMMLDAARPDLGEVAAALDDIIEEDNRAGEVIHRLRGLLKKGETKFEPVDLNEMLKATLRLLNSELIGRRVKIDCDLSANLPLTSGDPVQLQQVLLNLVMNAVEAVHGLAPSRRMVTIRTQSTDEGQVQVSVDDLGMGLAPSHPSNVFQPFFTTKERGLGLGLTICASIVKSHGGTLSLENNPSGGATAMFKIPADVPQTMA